MGVAIISKYCTLIAMNDSQRKYYTLAGIVAIAAGVISIAVGVVTIVVFLLQFGGTVGAMETDIETLTSKTERLEDEAFAMRGEFFEDVTKAARKNAK